MVADDTLLSIKANPACFTETCSVLQSFQRPSGLKINFDKSIICRLGKNNLKNYTMHTVLPFVWLKQGQPFKYLGINQIINKQGVLEEFENFSCSEFQIKTFVANLRYSHNTLIGRILFLKSLVASRFVYKFILLPAPVPF